MAEDTSSPSYSAFVSHAAADREVAEAVVADLEAKGLRCWIAPRDVRPGQEYASEIIRGIERSKCFVLLLSEASNLSANVRREVERAASKAKPIYPVRLEDVPPSPKLEYFISMHHWIDAWEGQLTEHVERLAQALDSSEEWITNKILKRRRRLSIGAVASLAVAAIVAGVVFAPDLRQFFLSEEERAQHELQSRGISLDEAGLASMLVSANGEDLELFRKSGATVQLVAEALKQTRGPNQGKTAAQLFFENSRNAPEAIEWFEAVLSDGLDPNMAIPNAYYTNEGILGAAFRASNAEAALSLLDAGASPHIYQEIWFTRAAVPRFLFPYDYLMENEHFTPEEKTRIAEAYQKAGAILINAKSDQSPGEFSYQPESVEDVIEGSERILGLPIEATPTACNTSRNMPICKAATKRTGFDWCNFAESLPRRVVFRWGESYSYGFYRMDLEHLLNVVDNKAYFLGTQTLGSLRDYFLIAISRDQRNWKVFQFMGKGAGRGFCKKDDDGFVPDYCWRRRNMTFDPTTRIMMVEDYHEYNTFPDCRKTRPE